MMRTHWYRTFVTAAVFAAGLVGVAQAQLSNDLALYYDFDNISGAVVVDKGLNANQSDGDIGANVTTGVTGMFGTAVETPGSASADGNYISIDDTPGATLGGPVDDTIFSGDFTVSVWMNFPAEVVTGGGTPISAVNWNAAAPAVRDGFGLIRKAGTTGDLARFHSDAGAVVSHFSETTLPFMRDFGNWHLYTWTIQNGGQGVWYVDGVSSATCAVSAYNQVGSTQPLLLGASPAVTSKLPDQAMFDDFAIWKRALSADEVAGIYAGGTAATPLSLADLLAQPEAVISNTVFEGQTIDRVYTQTLNLKVENGGDADLVINSISIDKGGNLSDTVVVDTSVVSFPLTVASGAEVQVPILWKPANTLGQRTFNLSLDSNALVDASTELKAAVVPLITQDLALYYNFDDIQGNVVKDIGENASESDGDIGANVVTDVAGVIGSAVELPGNTVADGNLITIDDTPGATVGGSVSDTIFTTDFSISVWFNFPAEADPAAGARTMGNVRWSVTAPEVRDGFGLIRKAGSSGDLLRVHDSNGAGITNFPESLPMLGRNYGEWHLQTWTFQKNGPARWYVDGALVLDNHCADFGTVGAARPFVLGGSADDTQTPDHVMMDEFAIWHRALDSSEVAKIYSQGKIGRPLISVTVPVEVSSFSVE